MKSTILWFLVCLLLATGCRQPVGQRATQQEEVALVVSGSAPARVKFGVERLQRALEENGHRVQIFTQDRLPPHPRLIVVGEAQDALLQQASASASFSPGQILNKEGFVVRSSPGRTVVAGADASGTLYGCLELADRIRAQGQLPSDLSFSDSPEMVLRGTCIGIQKTIYLPGRTVYEYPYTPENFPWLYDKELWLRYLDLLVENRYNSLYLWNGHPFASLVKLPNYPYAQEVDEETFRKNEEMYRFLTEEADKRGIWVIQMFYNILLPKPFAEQHGIKTQERNRTITPLLSDYTRKSIAAFVEKYPNVGLLVTLGEAMEGDENDVRWFTETIIPGVQDGLAALGSTTLPPIVLRGHDTNPQLVMEKALPLYRHLYTMNKYNGEALTTYEPRGPWAAMHQDLSRLGSTHIDNVHILANLEPFRYGSSDFIQKSVRAMHTVHGANGLHLFPESSYWEWPYTADQASPRLLQIDRDQMWYQAWARYAWNSLRDRQEEIRYWAGQLGQEFGCPDHGTDILEAYEQAGEITPKLLRRFGITNGNRQTLTLGMFMSQLVNPNKYRVWPHLYDSDGPEGEMLIEYAEKEWKGEPHVGETPVQIINEVARHGQLAVEAIERAAPHVTSNLAEFGRLKNDMYCHRALALFFTEKAKAALAVLRYQYSQDLTDLEQALPPLERSMAHFRTLADLTRDTYLYANSMQTGQRRIPISGEGGQNKTWVELVPHYERELEAFKSNLAALRSVAGGTPGTQRTVTALQATPVTLLNPKHQLTLIQKGAKIFLDEPYTVQELAPQLQGLPGVQFPLAEQRTQGTRLRFRTAQPVQVLVGYFTTTEPGFLSPPNLETNAYANDQGQADIRIANALAVAGMPPVQVHSYTFGAGEHTLQLGKGACLILGFVAGDLPWEATVGGRSPAASRQEVDYLFE